MNITKENYSEKVYNEFYNYFEKKVDTIYKSLESTYYKNKCYELEYGYEIWIENIYELAAEETGLQVECYDLQVEIQKDLESDFIQLDDEIKYHNETVYNEY